MKRGIISKALTGTMVLLLAGGCNTVYDWWDVSTELKPQEPVVSANPPAAEPPPPANPDTSPEAAHPVLMVPAEPVAAPQVARVPHPEPKALPPTPTPILNPKERENPGLAQAKEAEDALARAKERLDWATRIGARNQFPAPYTKANTAYTNAVKAQNAENWHDAVRGSQATIATVAEIEALLSALQAKEAEDALTHAKERLDWATGIGARSQFPSPYTKASTAYTNAVKAQSAENWHGAVSGSQATIAAVAEIEALLEALQAKEAEEALARAKERLDWATGIGARNQFPAPYTKANTAYNTAVKAQSAENWHGAVSGSQATIAAVAEIEALLATLQAKEAEEALVRAKERLDWATGIGARNQFPAPYTKANTAYNTAVKAQNAENWHDAVSGSQATIAAVAEIEALLEGLQAKEAEEALARAKERLDWATRIGARNQFPAPYTKASTAYNTAVKAQNAENWHDAVSGSQATIAAVAEIEALLAAFQSQGSGLRAQATAYVAAREAEEALARAKERLDWATRIGARNQFPSPYTKANTAYNTAVKAQSAENWHDAVSGSQATIAAVAEIEALFEGLQAKEAEDALARAKERLDWATRIGARNQFPSPYTKASTAYTNAIKAQNAENWHGAVSGSQATVAAVAEIEALLEGLQAKEAEDALARAKERLDWATGIGARSQFPSPYIKASTAYTNAVKAQNAENWHDAVSGSQATVAAVAEIEALLSALQAKEAEDALARAKERLDWATRIGARNQFPAPYTKASTAYTNAIKAQNAENWHDAVSGSQATIAAVAEIEALLEGLQAKEAEEALARAKERLDWATRIGARSQFPSPYIKASTAYTNAIKAQNAENWHSAVSGSQATIAAVAEIEALLEALQAKEAEEALARAKERLDWATGIGARNQFPAPYTKASTAYNTAIKAQNAKNWYDAVRGSQATIAAVAEIEAFLAALQAKDVGNARKVVETDTLPATEPRNPILSPIPEQPLKPMAPMPLNTEAPSTRSYIVQAGDSYRSIAKQLYGDVQMWRILYETNKGRMKNPNNPNLIFPGMTLDIPQFATRLPTASTKPMSVSGVSVQKEPQSIPEPVASRPVSKASSLPEPSVPQVRRPIPAVQEYTVKPGDSYWSIAYRLYGDVQHWRILYEANKGRMKNPNNPHLIFPGMVLTIPDSYLGDASRITAFIR